MMIPFGDRLRAARCGFMYSEVHEAYIRLRALDKSREWVQAEVCPQGELFERTRDNSKFRKKYLVLDTEDRRAVFESLPIPSGPYSTYQKFRLNTRTGRVVA